MSPCEWLGEAADPCTAISRTWSAARIHAGRGVKNLTSPSEEAYPLFWWPLLTSISNETLEQMPLAYTSLELSFCDCFIQGTGHGEFCKISSWACSYPSNWTPELRVGFSFSIAKLSLCPKSCFSTILAYSQAHFLSFILKDRHLPLDYGHLRSLFILICEMVGVLAGNMNAIVMPKKKEPAGRHPSSKRQEVCAGK